MSEKELKVGDIIESQCRKCSDVTGHAIVAIVDGQVAKVECRACKSVHKFYPAKEEAKAAKTRSGSSVTASKGKSPKKASQAKEKQEKKETIDSQWLKEIEAKDQTKAIAYSMQSYFEEQNLIDHPSFGLGIVQKTILPNKMDVLFKHGTKRLRCDLIREEQNDGA